MVIYIMADNQGSTWLLERIGIDFPTAKYDINDRGVRGFRQGQKEQGHIQGGRGAEMGPENVRNGRGQCCKKRGPPRGAPKKYLGFLDLSIMQVKP